MDNSEKDSETPSKGKTVFDIVSDILKSFIPNNIIRASINQETTRYFYVGNSSGIPEFKRSVEYIQGTNIIGILSFAILIGLSSSMLEEKSKPFRDIINSLNEIIVLCVDWLVKLAPIGVASLIIEACFEIQDFGESFKHIGLFVILCIAATVFHIVIVLSLLFFLVTRKNPFPLYAIFFEPWLLSFATASDIVCMEKG